VDYHTNFVKIGQTVAEISHLTVFKTAAVCHLGFKNSQTFGRSSAWEGEYASPYQISFVEILHLTFFQMATVCHLGFIKI